MTSLDSLPADQRAVLQLVLQRGRTYDDIAAMLSIDRAAVRQRALDAFDALGPSTSVETPQRALLTDYLLGQLPPKVADQVRDRLASSPPDRAWARVIASEIASLAGSPLPEIPVGTGRRPAAAEPAASPPAGAAGPPPAAATPREPARRRSAAADQAAPILPDQFPDRHTGATVRSSRRGGAVLLGLLGVVIVAVVVVLLATGGGGSHPKARTTASRTTGTTTPASTTTGTSTQAKALFQVNLVSPTGAKKTAGIAQVVSEGSAIGIVLLAQGVPPNTGNSAYAVWLANSATDYVLVGFVSQRVGKNGKLETAGPLPATASKFKQLLVALQTPGHTKAPGQILLEGSPAAGKQF